MGVRDFRELIAWQRAMDLVQEVYRLSGNFPREELYGLTSQIRRSAVSIPSNIAEGQGRTSTKEFLNHLSIANGSLHELETQLLIAKRLEFTEDVSLNEVVSRAAEVGRLIHGLIAALRKKL